MARKMKEYKVNLTSLNSIDPNSKVKMLVDDKTKLGPGCYDIKVNL